MRSLAMALTLRVRNCITATPRSKIVRLDLNGTPFAFRAGQAALLGIDGQPLRRPYSIACAPADVESTGYLEFLVQESSHGSHGSLGPHLHGLRRGALVTVDGPVGSFQLPRPSPDEHYLFVAGGSGISPLRSMMRQALAQRSTSRIGVAYSARTADELAYGAELRALARRHVIELLTTTTREPSPRERGRRGRLTVDDFRALGVGRLTRAFVCGPESLVQDIPAILVDAGVVPHHVHLERW